MVVNPLVKFQCKCNGSNKVQKVTKMGCRSGGFPTCPRQWLYTYMYTEDGSYVQQQLFANTLPVYKQLLWNSNAIYCRQAGNVIIVPRANNNICKDGTKVNRKLFIEHKLQGNDYMTCWWTLDGAAYPQQLRVYSICSNAIYCTQAGHVITAWRERGMHLPRWDHAQVQGHQRLHQVPRWQRRWLEYRGTSRLGQLQAGGIWCKRDHSMTRAWWRVSGLAKFHAFCCCQKGNQWPL